MMARLDVISAYKGYRGCPYSAYFDVNEMVCHSVPSRRKLQEGDIVKAGIGVIKEGYHADKTVTYAVGQISEQSARLIATANEAMWGAIAQCQPGNYLSDISHSIQTTAESAGYSVVKVFVGHGIGTAAIPAARIKVLCDPIISSVRQPVGCLYPAFETSFSS